MWTVAATALIAGLLIGLTGVGGVLLVPVLTQVLGIPVDRAIAASLLGFLVAGIVAAFVHLRRARLEPRPLVVLCLAAGTGALIGAATLDWLPAPAVRLFIALLAMLSGLHALASKPSSGRDIPSTRTLGVLGCARGLWLRDLRHGGLVMLIPRSLRCARRSRQRSHSASPPSCRSRQPLRRSTRSTIASTWNLATLAAWLVAGSFGGALFSKRLSGRGLTAGVALVLIVVGLWYGYATLAIP